MFFFGAADFFFAKRLFFRYGEGCVGRASRASVAGEWGYNAENSFSALFGFGPKSGGFVVQKRNETPETPETFETSETPETLSVDAGIAFL